jgi:hypothetical protein
MPDDDAFSGAIHWDWTLIHNQTTRNLCCLWTTMSSVAATNFIRVPYKGDWNADNGIVQYQEILQQRLRGDTHSLDVHRDTHACSNFFLTLESVSKDIGIHVDRILRMNELYQMAENNWWQRVELLRSKFDHLIKLFIGQNRGPTRRSV